jgi:hypothetical protein
MTTRLRQLWPFRALPLRRRDVFHLASAGTAALLTGAAGAAGQENGNPGTADVWTSYFRHKNVWGYVNRHSVLPGEPFEIMLSTGPARDQINGRLEFFRVEPLFSHAGQRLVWRSQPVLRTASAIGAHWVPALPEIDTTDWPPGYYSADFVEEATGVRDLQMAQLVVRNPRRSGAVLLKLCTNTYQAYNAWGGHSLYPNEAESRGAMVSFDRPSAPSFFEYDVYLSRWLEEVGRRAGFDVDYASNFDAHIEPRLLDSYPVVACGAHDEYWTKEEFDAFERRIFVRGQNTIFFGANTAYVQVRYSDIDRPEGGEEWGRQMICYKSLQDPIGRRKGNTDSQLLITAQFRANARRPETMLTGVAYQDWFPPELGGVPYYVADNDGPFFEGTGYEIGDTVADVVGYEWDNRDPLGDGARLWKQRTSRNAEIPFERIKVLFTGSASGERTQKGLAEAVYFESPAGARVFSSGSIRWCWGLGKPGFEREPFKRFNENLLRELLKQ